MQGARFIDEVRFNGNLPEGSYLRDLPVVKYLSENKSIKFSKNVTFFVGENGTVKT